MNLKVTAARLSVSFTRLLALSMLGWFGCGSATVPKPAPEPPRVAAFQPGDELARLDQGLQLVFNQDMVGIDEVGPSLSAPPLQVTPSLPLRVHWEDRHTLAVEPEAEWQAGERYTLSLLEPLAARLQGGKQFVFDATPLRISGTSLPERNAETTPSFSILFSLPVDREQVLSRCAIVAPDRTRHLLALVPPESYDGEQVVRVLSLQPLALATRYSLDCAGLVPRSGQAPVRYEPAAVSFMTHGLLTLQRGWPEAGSALPPERAELCMAFSTPVDREELAAHVHVTPAPEGLSDSWYYDGCIPYEEAKPEDTLDTHRKSSLLLAPGRHYRVQIDAALRDRFGQSLGKEQGWEFQTSDRIPGLWTATGSGIVLEQGRAGHALGALNLDSVSALCLPLTAAKMAASVQPLFDWVYARDAESAATDPVATPWQLMAAQPRATSLVAKAPPNVAKQLPLDLAALCGLPSGQPGLFAVELTPRGASVQTLGRQGDDPARAIANVTDLGVVAKRGASSALAWVTRLSSGALVSGADVTLYGPQGQALAHVQTDAHGLARFGQLPASTGAELFEVRSGQDAAVVGSLYNYAEGLRPWQLDVREGDEAPLQLFVHTDRGVYRPGERVYVHGLAREQRDGAPARVPAVREVKLRLYSLQDSEQTLLARALSVSDFGSFASQLDLPQELTPGEYSLEVTLAERVEQYPIHVAEFRPLTFELVGELARAEVFAQESVKLALRAQYLFGTPLSSAPLTFTVERSPAQVDAPGFEEFSFADHAPLLPDEAPLPDSAYGLLNETSSETDEDGRAELAFDTEANPVPLRYIITASATDAAEDRATRVFSLISHSGDRYPGVRMSRSVYGAAEQPQAQVVLVNRSGKPVAGAVDAELRRVRWDCADPVEHCRAVVEVLQRKRVAVSNAVPAVVQFDASGPGSLHVRVSAVDGQGRGALASDSAYVWSLEGAGPYEDTIAAPLEADKRSYRVGERARLALRSALAPSHMLLTAERGDILQASVLARTTTLPEIVLDAASAPNVFVGLTGMTPRTAAGEAGRPRLVAGMHELTVQGESRALRARITTQRERYEPGEQVTGEVLVDHLGRGLSAEVALAVVNESVLQLTGFTTPDPTRVFHAPRGLSVHSYSNVPLVVADPAAAAAVPETARVGVGGEDGPAGRPDVRNDYVAAAYIAPDLRTDAQGKVAFSFVAPSDLSAYRLMVVAAAKDDRVGSADARITVAQPLSARIIAPAFLSSGDRIEVGALVHDMTGTAGSTAVQLEGQGLTLEAQHSELNASASGSVFQTLAEVQAVDKASLEVEVHKGQASDRVRRELVVRRPTDTEVRVLMAGRAAKAETQVSWPAKVDPQQSRVELTIDRAGLAPLAPALVGLMDYPYGCTEQTAAALLALSQVPELAAAVVPGLGQRAQLEERVAQGLARLRAARVADGHYALYPGMGGHAWLSALVLESFVALRDAGFSVPAPELQAVVALLTTWLSQQALAKLDATELDRAAHMVWLLSEAGAAPGAALDQLLAQAPRLGPDALAYLLQAQRLAGRPESQRSALRQQLLAAKWRERERDPVDPFGSAERTGALILSALVRDGAEPERAAELASWLIARASDPEHTLSTRDVAECMRALSTWAHSRRAGAHRLRVGLDKRVLFQGTLSGAQVFSTSVPARGATGRLWIEADGEVSYAARRVDVSVSAPKPAFSHGMTLERRYLSPRSDAALGAVALSDIVQVELTLRTERAQRMVALTDPLPGGFSPLDPGLSSGRFAGCDGCENAGAFGFMRRRDDRIEAFAEWLPAGTHTLRYLVRATSVGHFSAPGASASLMYMPDRYARSAVGIVDVTH